MARDRANISTGLWADRDWRLLPHLAKYLYILLLTHPAITYAGVVDWRVAKLAMLSPDTTAQDIEQAAVVLQDARFIFVDEDAEEVLIRSYLRHDGILKQPKLSVSMANAYAAISSTKIQDVVVHELHRLHDEYSDWAAWKSPKVQTMLKQQGQDMSAFTLNAAQALPLPKHGLTPTLDQALGLPTTTATATATSTVVEGSGEGRKKPARRIPDSWEPNDAHKEYTKKEGINLDFQAERFRTHAEANDRRIVNWDAAFRNWLLKAEKSSTNNGPSPWDRKGIHD